MDTKDIWSEFKDRLNSPFFGSLIISWLIWNWQIPVLLLFYKHDVLIETKTSYIDAIIRFSGFWVSIVFPLLSAIIYTFISPYVKGMIKEHLAKVDSQTDENIYAQTDTTVVPVALFRDTRMSLKARESDLAQLWITEASTHTENAQLNLRLQEKELEIATIRVENSEALKELTSKNAENLNHLEKRHSEQIAEMMADHNGRFDSMSRVYTDQILESENIKADLDVKFQLANNQLKNMISLRDEAVGSFNHSQSELAESKKMIKKLIKNSEEEVRARDERIELLANEAELLGRKFDELSKLVSDIFRAGQVSSPTQELMTRYHSALDITDTPG